MVISMTAAFRCPGPDPQGVVDPSAGGGGAEPGTGGAAPECPENDVDDDQDGYTEAEGDCDDCNPAVHPGAAELATLPGDEAIDDDCDGETDEVDDCEPNEQGPGVSALEAAGAMELCSPQKQGGWGLLEAEFVHLSGDPASGTIDMQRAVTEKFGAVFGPRRGQRMLVLSTGIALDATHNDTCLQGSCGDPNAAAQAPSGFPKGLPGCASGEDIYDDVALNVVVRPPPNATGFRFHTNFLTHEYPTSVCSLFRDQFVALLTPQPATWASPNMVFDDIGLPPSADFMPFPHCDPERIESWAALCEEPCPESPFPYCPLDAGALQNTGFGLDMASNYPAGGATGWLETRVPLVLDEDTIEIRFMIADTEDAFQDSTVLIDGFTWLGASMDLDEEPVTTPE